MVSSFALSWFALGQKYQLLVVRGGGHLFLPPEALEQHTLPHMQDRQLRLGEAALGWGGGSCWV